MSSQPRCPGSGRSPVCLDSDCIPGNRLAASGSVSHRDRKGCACAIRNGLVPGGEMVTAEMGVLSASSDLFRVLLPRANRAVQTLLDYWAYTLSPPCSIVLEDPNTDYSPSRPHRPRVRFDEQQVLTQVLIMHRFGDYAARTVHQHEALLSTQCSTMSRFTVKWIDRMPIDSI